jgi:hypothetical protein
MRTIYKYPLVVGYNGISLPLGAEVVHIAEQYGQLQMWVEHDLNRPLTQRQFNVYGTGHWIHNDNEQHLATVIVDDFVWHVYENIFN